MAYRRTKKRPYFREPKKTKEREIKQINCEEELIMVLVAEVIKSALADYVKPIPKVKGNSEYQQRLVNTIMYNKSTAKNFFENSELFLASGLELEYLVAHSKDILKGYKNV